MPSVNEYTLYASIFTKSKKILSIDTHRELQTHTTTKHTHVCLQVLDNSNYERRLF